MEKFYIIQQRNANILKYIQLNLQQLLRIHTPGNNFLNMFIIIWNMMMLDYILELKKINQWDRIDIRHPMVQNGKNDRENIFYWLTRFKDDMIQFIISHKKSSYSKYQIAS